MTMNANSETGNGGAEKRAGASDGGAPVRSAWLRARLMLLPLPLDTPPRRIAHSVIRDGGSGEASLKNSKIRCTSHGASDFYRWRRSIRKNIIGHGMRRGTWHGAGHGTGRGMAVRGEEALAGREFRYAGRPFSLLDQPAREKGAGVFFHPLIEQSANLLAEIGGVGKPRKFVALKRITRSREEKLPRRLGWGTGHGSLLRGTCAK